MFLQETRCLVERRQPRASAAELTRLHKVGTATLLAVLLIGCGRSDQLPPLPPAADVAYLDQGWTADVRRDWYHRSHGSQIMPYDWLLALEQSVLAGGGKPRRAVPR